ncbi:MAG: hypothetical protein ACT6QS_14320 [Flavobacteriales bacterium]
MNEKLIRFARIVEWIWLIFGFIFIGLTIWKINTLGTSRAAIYFMFPLIAFIMYYMRRRQRIRLEKQRREFLQKERDSEQA